MGKGVELMLPGGDQCKFPAPAQTLDLRLASGRGCAIGMEFAKNDLGRRRDPEKTGAPAAAAMLIEAAPQVGGDAGIEGSGTGSYDVDRPWFEVLLHNGHRDGGGYWE